ncbi:MAG: universal stress protein [Desulfuromonadaceae bacterium]|nr:universal stress protein [Desulfuromonadaceae bacterium]
MKQFKNILYVSDATDDQDWAVARAVSVAESNQASLTIATAADAHYAQLQALAETHKERLNIRFAMLQSNTHIEVVRAVMSNANDLVLKPAENPSWLKRIFGNFDMNLLRQCPCPVWLMKPHETPSYNNILAAVDFDPLNPLGQDHELNREILDLASRLALSNVASLHIAHAWEAIGEKTLMSRDITSLDGVADYVEKTHIPHRNGLYLLGEELRETLGVDTYKRLSPSFHLPKGPGKKMIPQLAEKLQVDLVVMGTIARTGISGLIIGNTAEAILDQLACSVLAVKPPDFKTEVKLDE